MDEYKEHIYERNRERWDNIETGDLSYMLGVKKKLNCKPFSYFLEEVAPDMVDRFPPIEPPAFASGAVSERIRKMHRKLTWIDKITQLSPFTDSKRCKYKTLH